MAGKFHPVKNFVYAFQGLKYFFSNGPIAIVHLVAAVFVIAAGVFFKLDKNEWIVLSICIGLMFSAEMFNTAIEMLVDKISPEKNEFAGKIKDVSAGAVLVTAMFSAVAGLIIFLPKVIVLLQSWN